MATLSQYRMREIYQNLLKTIMSQRNVATKTERAPVEEDVSSVESLNDLSSVEDLS